MKLRTLITICFTGLALSLAAQQNEDVELAEQYMSEGEYAKAKLYFEKLYGTAPERNYYKKLLECYIRLDMPKDAEKLIKKQQKREPFEVEYKVDMGLLYRDTDQKGKAKQIFDKLISKLDPSFESVEQLATAFQAANELDYALKTYLKAKKLIKNYGFNFEIASIYNQQKEYDKMIGEYLDVLEKGSSYVQSVQNALQTNLDPDPENIKKQMLKTELLRRIQKNPDQPVYSEMIIWVFIQEKNFYGAFMQAKALDKRKKEDGFRLYNLGAVSLNNQEYDVASECFQYVVDKGPQTRFYDNARMKVVKVLQEKITRTGKYTEKDLTELDNSYSAVVKDLGKSWRTVNFIRDWAKLKAEYLNDKDKAVELLSAAITMGGTVPQDKARCKIALADVYLMYGAIWDANLLYLQVEKDFKHDRLGEEAKFKSAKVSFYAGDFAWSKAQLDVLKASTSKLIANDAMRLSLLITDNTIVDTNKTPLMMFARADLLLYRNKSKEALVALDSISSQFPGHSLTDEVLFKRFQVYKKNQDFEKAAAELTTLVSDYSQDILADDALYELATMNEFVFKDNAKAVDLYKQLLLNFPGSLYADPSRKSMRKLREKDKFFRGEKEGDIQIKEWE